MEKVILIKLLKMEQSSLFAQKLVNLKAPKLI